MSVQETLLGIDVGSSGIKVALLDVGSGAAIAEATSPSTELPISSPKPGWAEQHPDLWWEHVRLAIAEIRSKNPEALAALKGIGVAYQMHGLVLLSENGIPLRPSIIWCDGRAAKYGEKAFKDLGQEKCLKTLLNSPGNFTVSKLAWVKENEPEVLKASKYAVLPGDYIIAKLTGEIGTSIGGLTEGMAWDFSESKPADFLFDYFRLPNIFPQSKPNIAPRGMVRAEVATELGLPKGVAVTYCAGDQPNNALALNVLEPGEVGANAGTSGVIFAVTEKPVADPAGRINTFAHVSYKVGEPRYGVLLCINGTACANRWLRDFALPQGGYPEINNEALKSPIGAKGLSFLPYGNGVERTLGNFSRGAEFLGLDFNIHNKSDTYRAVQEGIAFALYYGTELAKDLGVKINRIRAGHGNMFLSDLFSKAVAAVNNAPVELYNTSGAVGAAIGAGLGLEIFKSRTEAFKGLKKQREIVASPEEVGQYGVAYIKWKENLKKYLDSVN